MKLRNRFSLRSTSCTADCWLRNAPYTTHGSDIFLAFDLYDTKRGHFYSRAGLDLKLTGTRTRRVLSAGSVRGLTEDTFKLVVQRSISACYDGPMKRSICVERVRDRLADHAKIVGTAFQAW